MMTVDTEASEELAARLELVAYLARQPDFESWDSRYLSSIAVAYLARQPDFESWDSRYLSSIAERLRTHCDGKVTSPFRLLPEELPLILVRGYGAWQMEGCSPATPGHFPTIRGKLFGVETEIVFDRLAIISRWR